MSEELTIEYLVRSAKEVYPNSEMMQKVAVTQAVHESGTLSRRGPSQLAKLYKNLFGIKKTGTDGSVMMPTWEEVDGEAVKVIAPFAKNHTYADSFRQHSRLMHYRRYQRVLSSEDCYEAFDMLQICGYATDSKYPVKLTRIYNLHIAKHF